MSLSLARRRPISKNAYGDNWMKLFTNQFEYVVVDF